eukprot:COSAG06_NODE_6286_length_2998_cov_1.726457_2_plen_46_part_00
MAGISQQLGVAMQSMDTMQVGSARLWPITFTSSTPLGLARHSFLH